MTRISSLAISALLVCSAAFAGNPSLSEPAFKGDSGNDSLAAQRFARALRYEARNVGSANYWRAVETVIQAAYRPHLTRSLDAAAPGPTTGSMVIWAAKRIVIGKAKQVYSGNYEYEVFGPLPPRRQRFASHTSAEYCAEKGGTYDEDDAICSYEVVTGLVYRVTVRSAEDSGGDFETTLEYAVDSDTLLAEELEPEED